MPALKTYRLLNRLFPSSYILKIFFVAFVGTHVPLLSLIIYNLSRNGGLVVHLEQLSIVLVATLVGTAFTFAGLWAILAPVGLATESLEIYRNERRILPAPMVFKDGAGRLLSGVNALLAEVERSRETQERLAISDPLTGLINRRGFDRLAAEAVDRARERCERVALAIFDLDHFKQINDEFGHPAGDEALKAFAEILRVSARAQDLVARIGGEEFAFLIRDADAPHIETICEDVRRRLSGQTYPSFRVTTSIGAATLRAGETLRDLYKRADQALYLAKSGGRDRLMFDRQIAA